MFMLSYMNTSVGTHIHTYNKRNLGITLFYENVILIYKQMPFLSSYSILFIYVLDFF